MRICSKDIADASTSSTVRSTSWRCTPASAASLPSCTPCTQAPTPPDVARRRNPSGSRRNVAVMRTSRVVAVPPPPPPPPPPPADCAWGNGVGERPRPPPTPLSPSPSLSPRRGLGAAPMRRRMSRVDTRSRASRDTGGVSRRAGCAGVAAAAGEAEAEAEAPCARRAWRAASFDEWDDNGDAAGWPPPETRGLSGAPLAPLPVEEWLPRRRLCDLAACSAVLAVISRPRRLHTMSFSAMPLLRMAVLRIWSSGTVAPACQPRRAARQPAGAEPSSPPSLYLRAAKTSKRRAPCESSYSGCTRNSQTATATATQPQPHSHSHS